MARAPEPSQTTGPRSRRLLVAAAVGILAAYGAATVAFTAATTGDTSDEDCYRTAGDIYLQTHHFAENHDHPPLSKWLAALYPRVSGRTDRQAYRYSHELIYVGGGTVMALILLGMGMGTSAVVFAALFFLDPNLKAMASLNVLDADVAVLVGLTAMACWARARGPLARARSAFGIFLLQGLGAATKMTALGYLPFSVWALFGSREGRTRGRRAAAACAGFFLALLIAYHFRLMELGWFGASIAFQLKHDLNGQPSFFLGKPYAHGTPWYFAVLYFLKEPIPAWIACMAALGWALRRWRDFAGEFRFFYIPAAVIGAALSFASVQLGFRYLLPAVVLVQLGTAIVAERVLPRWKAATAIAVILMVSLVWIDARTVRADAYLAYFNALERTPTRDFCDSNNDWLQGLPANLKSLAPGALSLHELSAWELATGGLGHGPVPILSGASVFCGARDAADPVFRMVTPEKSIAGYELARVPRNEVWYLLWSHDHFRDGSLPGRPAAGCDDFAVAGSVPGRLDRSRVLMVLQSAEGAPGFRADGGARETWRAWMDQAQPPPGRRIHYIALKCW